MRGMELHHNNHDNDFINLVMWIGGIVCMVSSNYQPSEVRAWVTFTLGATASLISIIMNWSKFVEVVKKKFPKKTKTKNRGK